MVATLAQVDQVYVPRRRKPPSKWEFFFGTILVVGGVEILGFTVEQYELNWTTS